MLSDIYIYTISKKTHLLSVDELFSLWRSAMTLYGMYYICTALSLGIHLEITF